MKNNNKISPVMAFILRDLEVMQARKALENAIENERAALASNNVGMWMQAMICGGSKPAALLSDSELVATAESVVFAQRLARRREAKAATAVLKSRAASVGLRG